MVVFNQGSKFIYIKTNNNKRNEFLDDCYADN